MSRIIYVYKVLKGRHTVKDANGRTKVYRPGMILESSIDLIALLTPEETPPGYAQLAETIGVSPGRELFELLETRHYI